VFKIIGVDISARVAILRGEGKSFCAGADLNYMNSIAKYGYEENVEDGKRLARLFDTIYACEVPTIALVHGAAFGGANGLLAACDIVVAEEKTTFAFSEVKLGIAPATISPFVIKRIGEFGAKELMMTGKRFNGEEAEKWNLVNKSVPFEELEKVLNEYIKHFLTSAPEAVKVTKKMINNVISSGDFENVKINMAQLIAKLRDSDEGKEGMSAFLEKRKPKWIE
jgi:methylglutaconyl-CoA hydratase